MTVKELRVWLAGLPEEFDASEMIWRTIEPNPEDSATWVVTDNAIVGSGVDIKTNELYFCDMETANIINSTLYPDTETE